MAERHFKSGAEKHNVCTGRGGDTEKILIDRQITVFRNGFIRGGGVLDKWGSPKPGSAMPIGHFNTISPSK